MDILTAQWGDSREDMDDWGSDDWDRWEQQTLARDPRRRFGQSETLDFDHEYAYGNPFERGWSEFDE